MLRKTQITQITLIFHGAVIATIKSLIINHE